MKTLFFTICLIPTLLWAQPDTLWTRNYSFPADDYPADVIQTNDGGFLIVASSTSFNQDMDFFWIKTDSNGDTVWTSTIDRDGAIETVSSVIQTADNGYILAGSTRDLSSFNSRAYVVKSTPNGAMEWRRFFGDGSANQDAVAAIELNNSYIIVGSVSSGGTTAVLQVIQTDLSGNSPIHHDFPIDGLVWARDAVLCPDSGIAIVADYQENPDADTQVILIKYNLAGYWEWHRIYPHNGYAAARSIVHEPSSGGFYIAGLADSPEGDDFYLIHTASNGDTVWTRTYGGEGEQHAHDCIRTEDGDCILVGHNESTGDGDLYAVKINALGAPVWDYTFGGENFQGAEGITRTSDNGLAIVGQDLTDTNGSEIFLIRFAAELSSADENVNLFPSSFNLSAYPNPFNSQTTIQFELTHSAQVSLKLFDVSGRLVKTLADKYYSTGTHFIGFSGTDLSSGIYFCQLQAGQISQTQKLVLLK